MKNKIPNYDERIKPLIKEIQNTKGMEAKIVAEFGKLMGEPVHRNIVHGWLHPNAKKRNEPSYTRGMRLFEAITIARLSLSRVCPQCGVLINKEISCPHCTETDIDE